MDDGATRVTDHAASAELALLTPMLEPAEQRGSQDATASQPLARMRGIQEATLTRLSLADPLLAPEQVLNAIASNAQAWRGQLTNYITNGNLGHLQSAIGNADAVAALLAQLPISTAGRTKEIAAAARAYHASIQKYMQEVESRYGEATARATALATRAEQIETQLAQAVTQIQNTTNAQHQHFSQAQEERVNQFGGAQSTRATEFVGLSAEFREASNVLLHDEEASFALFRADSEKLLSELTATADARVTEMQNEFTAHAETLVANLEKRKKEADELVRIIAERGVTSNYQKVANEARVTMLVWQGITVVTLGVFLYVAVQDFLPALQSGWNWGAVAGRFFVTVAVALLAGYAGAEARESQKVMRANRQREMDLAAVGPYFADLPPDQRDEVRLNYADRTFITEPAMGAGEPPAASADGQSIGNALAAIVKIADSIRMATGK